MAVVTPTIETIRIAADETAAGELAQEIALNAADGALWIYQLDERPDGMRMSVVGMSKAQATAVRDALTILIEKH